MNKYNLNRHNEDDSKQELLAPTPAGDDTKYVKNIKSIQILDTFVQSKYVIIELMLVNLPNLKVLVQSKITNLNIQHLVI